MKKKLLYLAYAEMNLEFPDGVCKKVLQQTQVFNDTFTASILSYDGEQVVRVQNNKIVKRFYSSGKVHRRYRLYEQTIRICEEEKTDIVYIRYGYSDPAFIRLLSRLRKAGCRIVVEIPTYPYAGEAKENLKKYFFYAVDCIYRRQLCKYVDHIALLSANWQAELFEIPCIDFKNGVIIDEIVPRKASRKEGIHLLSVSSMVQCHGLDRMIEGFDAYYKELNNGAPKVFLHLVGKGSRYGIYQQMISKKKLDAYVILHGYKSGKELDAVYDEADIAIDALGLHRLNLTMASTLKTREYLAKGLPIVMSSQSDIFPQDYPYVLHVPATDEPIRIRDIIEFYNNVYEETSTPDKIAKDIRAFAQQHCDMKVVMKPVIDCISGL